MGTYPTLSHIGATYNFMGSNCQQKFQIFRGFLRYFELKMSVNILMLDEPVTPDIESEICVPYRPATKAKE